MPRPCRTGGFTLIELSIVLVIIGLIVGGVLTGRDLIKAAEIRAEISQLEAYNTAANTFQGKYGALPGDIGAQQAAQFGFATRAGTRGLGDGNGVIEGSYQFYLDTGNPPGFVQGEGETVLFWNDLGYANGMHINLIPESITATRTGGANISGPTLNTYIPQAKFGNGIYVMVYSQNAANYFVVQRVDGIGSSGEAGNYFSGGVTVAQTYAIDSKIDDGLPQTGRVQPWFLTDLAIFYSSGNYGHYGPTDTRATTGSATTCFDNGGSTGKQQTYSIEIGNGANPSCTVSLRLQ